MSAPGRSDPDCRASTTDRGGQALRREDWAAPALASVLERVAHTREQVGERFPLFADPGTGQWTTTRRGAWTGGFWAGLLWLRAQLTQDAADRAAASECTARLAPWAEQDTATRGLIFWYGTRFAPADVAAGPVAVELRERAARACLDAFDAHAGLVPWGAAFGGPRLLARADGAPGMVPLLATVDRDAAAGHLRTHLQLSAHTALFGSMTGWAPHAGPDLNWSRGRAWLRLAAAEGAQHLGASPPAWLLDASAAEPLVPPAEDGRTGSPPDTSAAAINAVALLKLGLRAEGEAVVRELVRSHLTDGRLLDGCYDLNEGTAVRHELIWGEFFLAYALAILSGLLDKDA